VLLGQRCEFFERFRRFGGLGIFSTWYTWSFVGFTAVLAGAAYVGLVGLLSAVVSGGSMAIAQIMGGSGLGHGLLALGRLGRPRKMVSAPGDDSPAADAAITNQVLDFFYNGVRIHVQERMHKRAKELGL
jgi:hypothetical protein